jgi:DNA-binding winged helix-turn-helix (wHTH) protein
MNCHGFSNRSSSFCGEFGGHAKVLILVGLGRFLAYTPAKMNQRVGIRNGYRFGPYFLDPSTGDLYLDGRPKPKRLRRQALAVLLELLGRAGEVVEREVLKGLVWKGREIGDPERGLNKIVVWIRRQIADSADNPCYIEVVPGIGFRFIAAVEKLETPRLDLSRTQSVAPDQAHILVEEARVYLAELARRTAELPPYYPAHLTSPSSSGLSGFDGIRQIVQVVEERKRFERWQEEERERIRTGG